MRSRRVGAVPPKGGWCSRFAKRKRDEPKSAEEVGQPPGPKAADEVGQRQTQVMSYFPARKGGPRMERLRHYWHVGMATLLEVDPDVRSWTTEVEVVRRRLDPDDSVQFTPHMWVVARDGYRALRLIDGGDGARARWLERNGWVRDRCRENGADLVVITREEVDTHPLLKTAKTILYHRRWDVPEEYALRVAAMADHPPATLGALHAALDPYEGAWPQVLALIGQGLIEIEMSGHLDPSVPVVACLAREAA